MFNGIRENKMFANIDVEDRDIAIAIIDIDEWHQTSILKENSPVRKISNRLRNEYQVNSHLSLCMAEDFIMHRAAHRFLDMFGATCT